MAGEQFSPVVKMGVRPARDYSGETKFHGEGSVYEALPEQSLNAVCGLIDKVFVTTDIRTRLRLFS